MSKPPKKTGRRSGSTSTPNGPGSKRPYSTINLKATEVAPGEKSAGSSSASSSSTTAKPDSGTGVPNTGKTGSGSARSSKSTSGSSSAFARGASGSSSSGATGPSSSSSSRSRSASSSAGKSAKSKTTSSLSDQIKETHSAADLAGSGGGRGTSTKAPPPPRSNGGGGGFFSHMTAGILGALLAFFGANYAAKYLDLPGFMPALTSNGPSGTGAGANADLTNRLAMLEKSVAAGGTSVGVGNSAGNAGLAKKLAATQARLVKLEALEQTLADLTASQNTLMKDTQSLSLKVNEGGSGGGADVTGRMARLEQTLAALGAAANSDNKNPGRIPQLAAISGRINDLETTLGTRLSALRKDIVQEIDSKVSQTAEASESAKSGALRLDRDVAVLRTSSAKLDQRLIELKASTGQMDESLRFLKEETGGLKVNLERLTGDLAAKFKQTAKPTDVTNAIAPVTSRMNALEQNLQGVVKSEQSRKATAQHIVLALELGNLKRAMDRGQNFAPELAEVKRVSGGALDLSVLEAHQSGGIATLSDLQKSFKKIAFRMIDAETINPEASVVDRLLHGAKSMIRVRNVNHAPDDASSEAIVGRMELALRDGRLNDVVTQAGKLKPRSLKPATEWLEKVKARQSVDEAIAGIEGKLKSSLGGTENGGKG